MNKRKPDRQMWVRIVALTLAGLLVLGVIFSTTVAFAEEETARDRYDLAIEILSDSQTARITQTVEYTNRTGRALNSMMFSVYANSLRRQTSVPVEADQMDSAFPEGFAPGGVDFLRVQVNGEDAEWGMQGGSELFMRVECRMEPGETVQFGFEFYVLLPVYSGAMGVGDLTWRLTNFYPVAAVWDEYLEDFPLGNYTAVNEPLYSEAADYHAAISLPETYLLAAPGTVSQVHEGDTVHYEIEAEGIRELALIFSRKMFEKTGETGGGVTVRALGNTAANAQKLCSTAEEALSWMEEILGEYPWPTLTLIETEYIYDGLSYPGVIQISQEALKSGNLRDAVYNLAAHQYFSGIVGSNRNSAPWLSEALCSYITLLGYMEREGYDRYLAKFNEQIIPSLQITIPGGMTVDSEAGRFSSRMEYEIVAVDRGCVVLHDMQQMMGYEKFLEGLRLYVDRMYLQNASASDFLAAMNEISGRRWDEFLYGQMHNMDDFVSESIEWYE